MDSEEHGHDNKAVYNVILVTVTILALACGIWTRHTSPLPPSVTLRSLSASYSLQPSTYFPGNVKYDDTKFFMNITVHNPNEKLAATLEYLDVWVYARKKTFLRSKLGQRIFLDQYVLEPSQGKDFTVEVVQDRPLRHTEWEDLIVSVFVRAQFPGSRDILGNTRRVHRTRDCVDLKATLHKSTQTAVVFNRLPMQCKAPY